MCNPLGLRRYSEHTRIYFNLLVYYLLLFDIIGSSIFIYIIACLLIFHFPWEKSIIANQYTFIVEGIKTQQGEVAGAMRQNLISRRQEFTDNLDR